MKLTKEEMDNLEPAERLRLVARLSMVGPNTRDALLLGAAAIEENARLRAALEMQFAPVPVGWSWAEWMVKRERIARAALTPTQEATRE
jgi:hypothetical protein